MSTIAEALDHPVSKDIAQHVWDEHDRQVERNKKETGPTVLRGEMKWNVQLGIHQFVPDPDCLDCFMDRIAEGSWAAGFKVTLTI